MRQQGSSWVWGTLAFVLTPFQRRRLLVSVILLLAALSMFLFGGYWIGALLMLGALIGLYYFWMGREG